MDAAEAPDLKHLLQQNDDQYRQCAAQHDQLDHRLQELTDRDYVSTSEQFEKITLKKRKLALKDRMEKIAREYAHAHSRAS